MEAKNKARELKEIYKDSFPKVKEAWELLCEARSKVGWKDFYYLVLRMQKETAEGSKYELKQANQ